MREPCAVCGLSEDTGAHWLPPWDPAAHAYVARKQPAIVVRAGGPCMCKPGRYVRFVIPPGVPGCEPVISCRANDGTALESIVEHTIPAGAEIQILVGSFGAIGGGR